MQNTRPYGFWLSPITSDLIVAESIGLSGVQLDGTKIYWLEGRPQEQGRNVLVQHRSGSTPLEVTPKEFNVRTRVHEYGGGAAVVRDDVVYFSHMADQRLYRGGLGATPVPLTPAGTGHRYADGVIDVPRARWIGVRESHAGPGGPIENTIVDVDLAAGGAGRVLASGNDFYSSPRLSPGGGHLAWLTWRHPNMPWVGTELWVADIAPDGTLAAREDGCRRRGRIRASAGMVSGRCAVFHFGPQRLVESSIDWNATTLARFARARRISRRRRGRSGCPATPLPALIGSSVAIGRTVSAAWHSLTSHPFSLCRSIFPTRTMAACGRGLEKRCSLLRPLPMSPRSFGSTLRPARPRSCGRRRRCSRSSSTISSEPEHIAFPTEGGKTAHAFYYPPTNPDYVAPPGTMPPLVVKCHGGPTAFSPGVLNLRVQYWTSRGIGVLDVNYGGSTGYGRAYRDRLHGQWGIVDVDDCINGARHVVRSGRADADRMVITGGSAGGYTTLMALTRNAFAGAPAITA